MKLNIGCAEVIIPGWINIDRNAGAGVVVLDVTLGLPYADNSVEHIFSAHFLEHLDFGEGVLFLKECHRVLVPGGVCRITVPDMNLHMANWLRWKAVGDDKIWTDYVTVDHYHNIYKGADNLFKILIQACDGVGDHKALYTMSILWTRLLLAGFSDNNILSSEYQQSIVEEMRGDKFDNRKDFTLFMEAIK